MQFTREIGLLATMFTADGYNHNDILHIIVICIPIINIYKHFAVAVAAPSSAAASSLFIFIVLYIFELIVVLGKLKCTNTHTHI